MPEYLAPGVFVEEVSFRSKSIEGVSTSTTGFVGPTRFGPVSGEPEILTSFSDFERIYGGLEALEFEDGSRMTNYLAHAVRHYFDEGGKRLYVARAFHGDDTEPDAGIASWRPDVSPQDALLAVKARHPGSGGNRTVVLRFELDDDALNQDSAGRPGLTGIRDFDVVSIEDLSPPAVSDGTLALYTVQSRENGVQFLQRGNETRELDSISSARRLTIDVTLLPLGRFDVAQEWPALGFHNQPGPQYSPSLFTTFPQDPDRRSTELFVALVAELIGTPTPEEIAEQLLSQKGDLDRRRAENGSTIQYESINDALLDSETEALHHSLRLELSSGHDGVNGRPPASAYIGGESATGTKFALHALEDLEDISIVAAPGVMHDYRSYQLDADRVTFGLVAHCEKMRYRVAVLDAPEASLPSEVQEFRSRLDTTRAALYYPWVKAYDPTVQREFNAPPSGFITGIYARNDVQYGVHKAPANEVIGQALGLEILINKGQQEILNPKSINCLRFFEGRGYRVWGARTASSDPEWKYLNVRRYFAFLERSIELGTQWAVFENNGPQLWKNVRTTITDFLFNEWSSNHLLGTRPDEAYFVRCDRTTMTQNDLDNGRLVCLIGVAPLRPAEFVIFRIGQKTASARN